MQACGDVRIGQHGRSVHETIPHPRRFPLLFFFHHHHLEIISQSIKPTVERLSYILYDSSISRDPHLLTQCMPQPAQGGVHFLTAVPHREAFLHSEDRGISNLEASLRIFVPNEQFASYKLLPILCDDCA